MNNEGDSFHVGFYNGYVLPGSVWLSNYVRAVRGGPCWSLGDWCIDDSGCGNGYECLNHSCEIIDDPPAIADGPFLAAGFWPVLPTSPEGAFVLDQNYSVLWTFSDDYSSCSGPCTHVAEYQRVGDEMELDSAHGGH